MTYLSQIRDTDRVPLGEVIPGSRSNLNPLVHDLAIIKRDGLIAVLTNEVRSVEYCVGYHNINKALH